jgi:hypothetical protein
VYIVLGVIGWYWWVNGGQLRNDLPVRTTRRPEAVALYLTALLQPLFIAMCALGLRQWRRSMKARALAPTGEAGVAS